VHTGDFTAIGVLDELRSLGPPVAAVQGNMDEPALRETLPLRVVVEAEDVRLGVVHDAGPARGRSERLLELFPGCDVVVYGHSHLPVLEAVGGRWIVNPGSPTERRRASAHTVAVVEEGVPRLVEI
jgi:uncharacterized protein